MTSLDERLDLLMRALPQAYPGPGGAVAILRQGRVLVRHAWGFANTAARIPFTPRTLFRICSITKQFTCATLLETFPDPSVLDPDIAAYLPKLAEPHPGALALCHNQSGLRDYWALGMLHGAAPETPCGSDAVGRIINTARTLQFAPGTRYSYANQNFRMLSEILEARTGRSFAELLRTGMFAKAGMESAMLVPNTEAMPDGTEGYEGTEERGFQRAENHIFWTGDAAICASLDDMIAWERFIDKTHDDGDGVYARMSAPVQFRDGARAAYGFGLVRSSIFGSPIVGHGGALRGWRSYRLYAPRERISIVVLFNHMADARAAAHEALRSVLGAERIHDESDCPAPNWVGAYVEPETELAVRIHSLGSGRIELRFSRSPEALTLRPDGSAEGQDVRIVAKDGALSMHRPCENQISRLARCEDQRIVPFDGRFFCRELEARLTIADTGGSLYGAFSGFLGRAPMERLQPIASDLWALPCPRALDQTPPGDWTLRVERDEHGRVASLGVGCWLARGLRYERET